jgi:hypothetical protein
MSLAERGKTERKGEQKCIHKGCILTMGYYIGGGQFICWLHALVLPGCMEAVKGQEMVALTGDSGAVTR